MPDRQWNEGLHQAVEAKEGVPITYKTDHAAQITYQSYFMLYKKLSGMTGTAIQNFWELRRVYKLWVVPVPTNRPCMREGSARPRLSDGGREVRRHRRGSQALEGGRPAGADRHALGGQVGKAEPRSCSLPASRITCSTPSRAMPSARRTSSPRRADRAPSPSPPTWPAAAPTFSWAAMPSPSPGPSSRPNTSTATHVPPEMLKQMIETSRDRTKTPRPTTSRGASRRPARHRHRTP